MFTVSDAQIQAWLGLLLWPFFRILAIMSADPFYSARVVPVHVRVALALMLSVVIAPVLPPMPPVEVVSPLGVLVIVQQIIIGLAIGFTMRLVFSAVEMAGHLAGLQMGLGFAQFFDPQHGANTAVVAQFASLLTILLFLSLNGHLVVIQTMVKSFYALPVSAVPLKTAGLRSLVESGGQIFTIGVLLALPLVTALLITNLSIGIMSRASPQFNLFAVGFPLTLGIGMATLYLTLGQFVPYIQRLIEFAANHAEHIGRMMTG